MIAEVQEITDNFLFHHQLISSPELDIFGPFPLHSTDLWVSRFIFWLICKFQNISQLETYAPSTYNRSQLSMLHNKTANNIKFLHQKNKILYICVVVYNRRAPPSARICNRRGSCAIDILSTLLSDVNISTCCFI